MGDAYVWFAKQWKNKCRGKTKVDSDWQQPDSGVKKKVASLATREEQNQWI